MTPVEYEALKHTAHRRNDDCPRLLNGLHAIEGHCLHCDARISASRKGGYQVRDNLGRVITCDWVY